MTPNQLRRISLCTLACALGCGAAIPPPNDEWAAAQAEVGRAQASGAEGVPEAKLHLQQAVEDLAMSKQAMGNDDNKRAASLCDLANVEARLARSLAKQAAAQDEARKAQEGAAKPNR